MDCDTQKSKSLTASHSFTKELFSILSLYWKSQEKWFAWGVTILLLVLSLLAVATALVINEWYKHFYDSMQAMNIEKFYFLIFVFLGVISFSVLRSVIITYLVDVLAIRWRRWLTDHYLNAWTHKTPNVKISINYIDNPDQRIAEDINKFTFETVDLACGLFYTLTSVMSFSIVLIGISGSAQLFGIVVPYYMFWSAIGYAVIGTYASQKIGSRLVQLCGHQQRMEADLRYCLIKYRDRYDDPNASQSATTEKNNIHSKLNLSLNNMRRTINIKARLSLFTESYSQLSLIFSSLMAAPRFFSGKITFGELMQINSAFGNLYENLSWFINTYPRLANWKATTDRLISFDTALKQTPDYQVNTSCPATSSSESSSNIAS